MRRALSAVVVIVVAGLPAGCSDDEPTVSSEESTTTTEPGATTSGGAGAVSVSGSRFQPDAVTVKVGESVTWTFRDPVGHSATADAGSFDSGVKRDGATFTQTFSTAGTFAYHCTIHSAMKATVTVS